jgi:hypothetical protein
MKRCNIPTAPHFINTNTPDTVNTYIIMFETENTIDRIEYKIK